MTENVSAARIQDSMLEISDSRLENLIAGLNIWTSAGRSQQPEIDMDLCCALMELQRVRAKALARTPSEGKVVAWRWRVIGDNRWTVLDHEPAISDGFRDRREVQPLFARPQCMEVKVKDIPWAVNGPSSWWSGELAFGAYYTLYDEGTGWRVFRQQFLSEAGEDEVAYVRDLDAAKAAAQADYEQRILSALTPGKE